MCDSVIFLSPLHQKVVNHIITIDGPQQHVVASPIDFDKFRSTVPFEERQPVAMVSGDARRVAPDVEALAKAEGYKTHHLDYLSIPYDQMPDLLNSFQAVVVAPMMYHSFGRMAVEAIACGCKLITNNRVGAMSYPDPVAASKTAIADFWRIILNPPAKPNPMRRHRAWRFWQRWF